MDAIQSIFTQLKTSRAQRALNESEEANKGENLDEGAVETPVEEVPAADDKIDESKADDTKVEEPKTEETPINEGEEFVVIRCHDCGAILSALDEAEEGCPVCGSDDLDEKTVRVVKDGKVVKKKVATRKKKLSAAQKAALAKARKKAHTAGAAKARKKSMAVRAKKGMNEEETVTCPDCGFEGDLDEFDKEDGGLICPECGAEIHEGCGDEE